MTRKLRIAFSDSFKVKQESRSDNMVLSAIWRPFLSDIEKRGEAFLQNQEEVAKLKEHEVLYNVYRKIAHDMRSPIGALDAIVKNSDSLPEKSHRLLINTVSRLRELTNGYLAEFKQNSVGKFSFDSLIEQLQEVLPVVQDVDVSLDWDPSISKNLLIRFNPIGFKNIVMNGINNSIEAKANQIQISISIEGNRLKVSLIDNGVGVDNIPIDKVLSGEFTSKPSGNGLGISESKTMMNAWGGDLMLSAHQEGAVLSLYLLCED